MRRLLKLSMILLLGLSLASCVTATRIDVPKYTDMVAFPDRPILEPIQEGEDALKITGINLAKVITYAKVIETQYELMENYYITQIETL